LRFTFPDCYSLRPLGDWAPFLRHPVYGNVTKVVFPNVSFRKVKVSLTICLNLNLSIIPTSKISKWLTNEFNNLPINQSSFSVQNSLDFINSIKDIKLKDSEILVSFDVNSLFPSVPIPQTLEYLKELLLENHLDDKIVRNIFSSPKFA
jgi:hypothetical protein